MAKYPKALEAEHARESVKALALIHGQTRASEISGIKLNTVKSWARRYNWKTKETRPARGSQKEASQQSNLHPPQEGQHQIATIAESYREELKRLKDSTELNLARYTSKASKLVANHKHLLRVTSEAKDIAQTHRAVFPPEEKSNSSLLQIGILIGADKPEKIISS